MNCSTTRAAMDTRVAQLEKARKTLPDKVFALHIWKLAYMGGQQLNSE